MVYARTPGIPKTSNASDPSTSNLTPLLSLYPGRRVAFIGDSITAGSGASSSTYNFVNQTGRIAGSARVSIKVNAGVGGENSTQVLARVPAVLTQGVDHAHIQVGTNDAGQGVSLQTFQNNIASMVTLCRNAGVSVSLGLLPPRASTATASISASTRIYNLWLQLWCAKQGIPLADTFTPVVDLTTGFLAAAYNSGDGTHPSDAGHLAMAKAVASTIAGPQLFMPWFATSPSPIGLIANPCMNGTTGWSDRGGTGTATIGIAAATPGDGLPAGNWLTYRINNSAGGSGVNRSVGHIIDATKYSVGDELAVCAITSHSDLTLASNLKIHITSNDVAFTIPLASVGSVNNPGPVFSKFTVPSNPATLRVGYVLTAAAGVDVTGYLGCVQVWNLTTGGLSASA